MRFPQGLCCIAEGGGGVVVVVVVVAGDGDIGGQVSGCSHSVGEMMYPE